MQCSSGHVARRWFLLLSACIVSYVAIVTLVGPDHVKLDSLVNNSQQLADTFFTATSFTPITAQETCRSDKAYVPSLDDLIVNEKWAYEWDEAVMTRLLSSVLTNTTHTLHMEKLPFLRNFKNPCWLERLHSAFPYAPYRHNFQYSLPDFTIDPGQVMSRRYHARMRVGRDYRMRCLPYYFIIGPQKTGTTDLFQKMNYHPFLRKGRLKEPHFWPRSKNINGMTLTHYADLFDEAAEDIAAAYVGCQPGHAPFHPLVTGEATAETMWDNWYWRDTPENANLTELRYLTAHHIRHVIPQARIIAILRDPVDRLVSDFYYFGHAHEKTAESLHKLVSSAVLNLSFCFNRTSAKKPDRSRSEFSMSRKACIYDPLTNEPPIGNIWDPRVRLRMGLYSEYLTDWFKIFPSNQIHIVNFDDYASNRSVVLNSIFDFLGLEHLSDHLTSFADQSYIVNKNERQVYAEQERIWPETAALLRRFYAPYNRALARLTQRTDWLKWNRV